MKKLLLAIPCPFNSFGLYCQPHHRPKNERTSAEAGHNGKRRAEYDIFRMLGKLFQSAQP